MGRAADGGTRMQQQGLWARRSLMSGIGAFAAAFAFGSRRASAQAGAAPAFQPARHSQDEWLDKIPGQHRVVFDVTSAKGVTDAIRFVGNTYSGNKSMYGLDEPDLAIVVVLRHSATAFGYSDAVWTKYATALARFTDYTDPKSAEPPKGNPFTAAPRHAFDGLAKRGVQFGVCETASHGIARSLAAGGDADATFKEMAANMIPASRLVAAGVIGVTRAQEYGYGVVYCG